MSATRHHWDKVYSQRAPDTVSWHQAEPVVSLALINDAGLGPDARIIDVGAGTSELVGRLLERGYRDLTALDISDQALEHGRLQLAGRAGRIAWLAQDVTRWKPPQARFDLWHDRAVFHFLVEAAAQRAYVAALRRALAPDGYVILATFAPTGPATCSGLPVRRYGPQEIQLALGPTFELVESLAETHLTPASAAQDFTWCLLRRRGS